MASDQTQESPSGDTPPVNPRPDLGAELMLAWRDGDDSAFERLVEAYSGQVYALLTRFLGRHPGREDFVPEVFLRVVRSRERYEPRARFTTWLYRIVFNLAVNETQRGAGKDALSLDTPLGRDEEGGPRDIPDEAAPDPAEGLERGDVVEAVRGAIESLPENQRMALVLAKYEGMAYAEIGDVMGSSEKAIKSLIHRARERLRELLSPYLMEELA